METKNTKQMGFSPCVCVCVWWSAWKKNKIDAVRCGRHILWNNNHNNNAKKKKKKKKEKKNDYFSLLRKIPFQCVCVLCVCEGDDAVAVDSEIDHGTKQRKRRRTPRQQDSIQPPPTWRYFDIYCESGALLPPQSVRISLDLSWFVSRRPKPRGIYTEQWYYTEQRALHRFRSISLNLLVLARSRKNKTQSILI